MRRAGLVGVAAGLLVAGCALEDGGELSPRAAVRAGEFGTEACFLRRTVMDFDVLDDRNVVVFAPSRADPYHVQVSPPAPELRYATALAFESGSSRICGYAGDALLVDQAGGGPQRLSVIGVYRLDAAALAGLEARFGLGAPPQRPPPQPGSGAEVERDLGGDDAGH